MSTTFLRARHATAKAVLLLAAAGLTACGDIAGTRARVPAPPPSLAGLSAQQQQLFTRAVPPGAAADRPATREELQAVRAWFAPGELEALLTIANRRAAARGEDTIPHCVPLCGPAAPQ